MFDDVDSLIEEAHEAVLDARAVLEETSAETGWVPDSEIDRLVDEVNHVVHDSKEFIEEIKPEIEHLNSYEHYKEKFDEIAKDHTDEYGHIDVEATLEDMHEREMRALDSEIRHEQAKAMCEEINSRRMALVDEKIDRTCANAAGMTLNQWRAVEAGYTQVFPHNMYHGYTGDPDIFTKGGHDYRLMPSGELQEI